MEEGKIKISFGFKDQFDNKWEASSEVEVFENLGETTLDVLGEHFNNFLNQIGYVRKRGYMLMDDITEDELWKLTDYLHTIRNESDDKECECEDE